MSDELLACLDEVGNPLPQGVLRSEAHRRGIWHRSVSVFVLNSHGEILLEKRSKHKDLFPNLYDIPGGHVKFGQDSQTTAREELAEELRLPLVSPLILLSKEDGVIERAVLPEKGIVNLERKTIYLVEIREIDEAALLFSAAEFGRLSALELERRGAFGEVSHIEFWPLERVNEALRSRGHRVLASGTESALSNEAVADQVLIRCLALRDAQRQACAQSKGNPLQVENWQTVNEQTLLDQLLPPPQVRAGTDLVNSVFEDGGAQIAGAYKIGPVRLGAGGDEYWAEKLEDPYTRYVDNLLLAAAHGRSNGVRLKLLDAREDIRSYVARLLNFPLGDGRRLRDGLGNLADIAVAREAVLLWLKHNMGGLLCDDDLSDPTRAVIGACLNAGREVLTEWQNKAAGGPFERFRQLLLLGLSASAVDFNNPRFQEQLTRKTRPGPWIRDFFQSSRQGELCAELGSHQFLDEFFSTYVASNAVVRVAFLAGNSAQAYISLAICQELLEQNPFIQVLFISKSGAPGTDLRIEDARAALKRETDGLFAGLNRYEQTGRFVIVANGPATHGLDPARLSKDVAEALANADVILAEGQAYAEIRGWKKPAYIAFRVNGRIAEAIHGISRERGGCGFVRLTPGINHFEQFEAAILRKIEDPSTRAPVRAAAQTTSEYVTAVLGKNFSLIVKGLFRGDRREACRHLRSEAQRLEKTFAQILIGVAYKRPEPALVQAHFDERTCPVFACGGGGGFNAVTLRALRMLGIATVAGVPSTDDGGSSGDIQRRLISARGFVFGVGDMAGILQDSIENKGKQAILAYRLDSEPPDLPTAVLERITVEMTQPTYSDSPLGAAPDFLSFVSEQLNLARVIDRSFRAAGQKYQLAVKGSSIRNLNLIAAYELCGELGTLPGSHDGARLGALYVLEKALGTDSQSMVLPVTYEECTLYLDYVEPVNSDLARDFGIGPDCLKASGHRLFGQRYIDKLPQPGGRRTCGVLVSPDNTMTKPRANPEYLARLRSAKLFIMGAGSLFGSQLSQLAVPGVVDTLLSRQDMRRLLVINHVKMDETRGMGLADHIRVIETVANECAAKELVERLAPATKRLRISDLFTDIVVPRTVAKETEAEMARCGYQWDLARDRNPEFLKIRAAQGGATEASVLRNRYVDFLIQHPEIQHRLQVTLREIAVLSYLDQPMGLYSGRSEAGRYRGALFASDQDIQYIMDQGIQPRSIHQIDSIGENSKLLKSEGTPKFEFFPGLVPEALMGIIRIALERGAEKVEESESR